MCVCACVLVCVLVCVFTFIYIMFALQRSYLTAMEKAITAPGSFSSSNKVLVEVAVVCGVELTKACTYINDHNNTIFRYYVTLLQNSLQVSNKTHYRSFILTEFKSTPTLQYVNSHSATTYVLQLLDFCSLVCYFLNFLLV